MDDGPGRPGHLAEEAGLFAVEGGHLQQKQSGILHNIHSQLYIGYNDRLEEKQNEEIPVGPICLINLNCEEYEQSVKFSSWPSQTQTGR